MSASVSSNSVLAPNQSRSGGYASSGLPAETKQQQNAARYRTTLRHAMNLFTWAQSYTKYTMVPHSQVTLLKISEIEEDRPPKFDCVDVYLCECAGIAAGPGSGNQTKAYGENGCRARFVIYYPPYYEHTSEGGISTEKHGKDKVCMIWDWKHNHPVKSLEAFRELSKFSLREADFYLATTCGLGWNENMIGFQEDKDPILGHTCEAFKRMLHHNVCGIREKMLLERAIKSDTLSESMKSWSKQIGQDGFAEFKDEAGFLNDLKGETRFETSSGKKIWSFKFMSNWQRDLLLRSDRTIYLDSAENVCSGFDSEEDVFLSTILVKSGRKGHGFPVAFLLTNSQNDFVLADFFKQVKDFCQYTPKQILIDCDIAEEFALKRVWPGTDIVSCRWHKMKDLKQKALAAKVDSLHKKKKVPKQADADFDNILACSTRFHSAHKLAEFYNKYEDSTLTQRYIENRWRNYFKDKTSATFLSSETFTDIICSYNDKLTMPFMRGSEHQRPDVFVYKLYKRLKSVFRAEPLTERPTPNQRNEALSPFRGHGYFTSAAVLASVFFEGDSRCSVQCAEDETHYVNILRSAEFNATCSCTLYNCSSWCLHVSMVLKWTLLLKRLSKKMISPKEPVEKFLEELLENPLENPFEKPLKNQSQSAVFTSESTIAVASPPTNDVKRIKLEASSGVSKLSKCDGPRTDHKQIQKMVSSQQEPFDKSVENFVKKPSKNHSQSAVFKSESTTAVASPPTNDVKRIKLEASSGVSKLSKYDGPRTDHKQIQKMVSSQQEPFDKSLEKIVKKPSKNHSQPAVFTPESITAIASSPTNSGIKRATEFPRVDVKKIKLEASQGVSEKGVYEGPKTDHKQIQKMVTSQQTFPMPMPDLKGPCYSGLQAEMNAPTPFSTPGGPNLVSQPYPMPQPCPMSQPYSKTQTFPITVPNSKGPCDSGPQADSRAPLYSTPAGASSVSQPYLMPQPYLIAQPSSSGQVSPNSANYSSSFPRTPDKYVSNSVPSRPSHEMSQPQMATWKHGINPWNYMTPQTNRTAQVSTTSHTSLVPGQNNPQVSTQYSYPTPPSLQKRREPPAPKEIFMAAEQSGVDLSKKRHSLV